MKLSSAPIDDSGKFNTEDTNFCSLFSASVAGFRLCMAFANRYGAIASLLRFCTNIRNRLRSNLLAGVHGSFFIGKNIVGIMYAGSTPTSAFSSDLHNSRRSSSIGKRSSSDWGRSDDAGCTISFEDARGSSSTEKKTAKAFEDVRLAGATSSTADCTFPGNLPLT